MERIVITTEDGSASVAIPAMNITYHSTHGAIQESRHVFLNAGFHEIVRRNTGQPVEIFEMGFGTGLNALLTLIEAAPASIPVRYTTVELHPLAMAQIKALNYGAATGQPGLQSLFEQMHSCEWGMDVAITPTFTLHKIAGDLQHLPKVIGPFHLVYYDAFAPAVQPELWTHSIFKKINAFMHPGGLLVTYCCKGDVRRAMQAAGFSVEKIQGPPGKREMIRAARTN